MNEEVSYELWVVADDADDCATDFEVLLAECGDDSAGAMKLYDYYSIPKNLKAKFSTDKIKVPEDAEHFYLRLEAVIPEGPDMMLCNETMEECEVKIKKKKTFTK